jgi:hypothetical protein
MIRFGLLFLPPPEGLPVVDGHPPEPLASVIFVILKAVVTNMIRLRNHPFDLF